MSSLIKAIGAKISTLHPAEKQGLRTSLLVAFVFVYDLTRGTKFTSSFGKKGSLAARIASYGDVAALSLLFGMTLGASYYFVYKWFGRASKSLLTVPIKALLHYCLSLPYFILLSANPDHVFHRYALLLIHLLNYGLVPVKYQVSFFNLGFLLWNAVFAEIHRANSKRRMLARL
jgi:hypothetical protein